MTGAGPGRGWRRCVGRRQDEIVIAGSVVKRFIKIPPRGESGGKRGPGGLVDPCAQLVPHHKHTAIKAGDTGFEDEKIDTESSSYLGLTVSSSRCHDHNFDPIPTRDNYALDGIFRSTKKMANLEFVSKFNERRITRKSQLASIEAHEK